MIKINAGLPFEGGASSVFINWVSDADSQRWLLRKAGGKLMWTADATPVQLANDNGENANA